MTPCPGPTRRPVARVFALGLVLAVGTGGWGIPSVAAQPATGWFLGAGAGFGWGTMTVESDLGKGSGLVLLGQVGLVEEGARTWSAEVEGQIFRVPNPVLDERYHAVRGVVRRSFGRPFFVAPALGVEYRRWSGFEELEGHEAALALAATVGRHVPLGDDVILLPEVAWSWTPLGRVEAGSGASVSLRLSVLRPLGG